MENGDQFSSARFSIEDVPSTVSSDIEVEGLEIVVNNIFSDDDRTASSSGAEVSTTEIVEAYADSQDSEHVSIDMPPSPRGILKKVSFNQTVEEIYEVEAPVSTAIVEASGQKPPCHRSKDKRYDSFKTWSGNLERQISSIRGKREEEGDDDGVLYPPQENLERECFPVDRFFDALHGTELDKLKPSEVILLPVYEPWPFFLRFPITSFGLCLGVSSQAIMWKALATSPSTKFLNVSLRVNLVLWWIAVVLVCIVSIVYLVKMVLFFEACRREYYHPIRANFFFAPWIALLFLLRGIPPSVHNSPHHFLWYILMAPIFGLELKIYGQWILGGQRRLSRVANPSTHLSIVGNFAGAFLGASMGLKEGPVFFFAVGMAHYIVLFVTLYQRLDTNETLSKELHPVFFLYVATPSIASVAWTEIRGSFDYGSRIAYFIAMFLYLCMVVRVNFFRGFTFSLAWWAYTFPMTGAATATIIYSEVVTNVVTKSLTVILCAISTLTVSGLLVSTIFHLFVLRDLFPNDIAIAIRGKKLKSRRHQHQWFSQENSARKTTEMVVSSV